MAGCEKDDNPELAEHLDEPPDAEAGGLIVGSVQGLIWSDVSGVDIVSVAVEDAHIAVPIKSDIWRGADVVELKVSPAKLAKAPRVRDLQATGGARAVELVSNYFSMPLAGPPPGPINVPLPPWWETEETRGAEKGDDSTKDAG